jgi:CPA2 family monovalent cation:H+ antiporter-2
MMIDPKAMAEYGFPILCVTLLALFGKMISTTAGALLSGQPLKQSVQVGMSMAQIGEFAFIVATLGLSLGVISDFLFPVAVGASAITTFTTPYLIKFSEPLYNKLKKILPQKMVSRLDRYTTSTQHIQSETEWKKVVKSYVLTILTNSIIIGAILFLSLYIFVPWLQDHWNNVLMSNIAGLLLFLGISSTFLWGLMAKKIDILAYKEMWMNKGYSKGPLLILELIRILIGLAFISFFVFTTFEVKPAIIIIILIVFVIFFVFSRRIQQFYQALEGRFLGNLNAREDAAYNTIEAKLSRKKASIQSDLTPWDAHITEMRVPGKADYVGRKLAELEWRETHGINIVYIKRGDSVIHLPGRDSFLLPLDRAGVIGTDEQLRAFKSVFDSEKGVPDDQPVSVGEIILKKLRVDEFTRLRGLSIRDSRIREKTNGLVIGIERNDEWILNPESTMIFEWEDIVWIVGERKQLQSFIKKQANEKDPGSH